MKADKRNRINNEENKKFLKNPLSRRQLLMTMGTVSGTMLFPNLEKEEKQEKNKLQSVETAADVLIVGGGTAGTIAAIQSARCGAATVILEKGSQLGGTMTTGGVDAPGLFFAWGRQVVAGIGWELVKKTVDLSNEVMPDFSIPCGQSHWRHQVKINSHLYAALAEEACLNAGVKILYYELPLSVVQTNNGWEVDTVGKGIRRKITCKQIIDCTGGADVTGMLGFPRLREKVTQPGTLIFKFAGYEIKNIDAETVEKRYREALQNGLLKEGDVSNRSLKFMHFLGTGGRNAQHVFGADSSTSETQTFSNIKGRESLLRLLRFVRSLPGCENTYIEKMAPETGVRETFRIDGETKITYEDFTGGRVFEDAVCYTFYPIDVHDRDGVEPRQLKEGTVPTIPLRALIPKNSRNFLAAGRSVSSDRLANSALRVQASCMAMGQAAGAAAVLASRYGITPGKVSLNELKTLLKEHNAIVPG